MTITCFCKRTIVCSLAIFAAGLFPAAAQQQTFESAHEQELRQEAFWSTHRDPTGKVRPDLWQLGIHDFVAMKAAQQSSQGQKSL